MRLKNKKIFETRRENGDLVGREVSRQRRWQLRNPEKRRATTKRYKERLKLKI